MWLHKTSVWLPGDMQIIKVIPKETKSLIKLIVLKNIRKGGLPSGNVVKFECFGGSGFVGLNSKHGPTHCSSSHAVAASHIQNIGRLVQILAQGQSSSPKRKRKKIKLLLLSSSRQAIVKKICKGVTCLACWLRW